MRKMVKENDYLELQRKESDGSSIKEGEERSKGEEGRSNRLN